MCTWHSSMCKVVRFSDSWEEKICSPTMWLSSTSLRLCALLSIFTPERLPIATSSPRTYWLLRMVTSESLTLDSRSKLRTVHSLCVVRPSIWPQKLSWVSVTTTLLTGGRSASCFSRCWPDILPSTIRIPTKCTARSQSGTLNTLHRFRWTVVNSSMDC